MKSLLTVRGNLLLVNLVVIGLILWLTISFLYIAAAQRSEAIMLQNSIANEQLISEASDTITDEFLYFSNLLRARIQVAPVNTRVLGTLSEASNTTIDSMGNEISQIMQLPGYVKKVTATESGLQQQLDALKIHRIELDKYRKDAYFQLQLPEAERNRTSIAKAIDSLLDLQNSIALMAKGLKYLPDFDAATIDVYHTLLNDILLLNVDIARKNSASSGAIYGNVSDSSLSAFQYAVLEDKIDQRVLEVVRLAHANADDLALQEAAINVSEFYFQVYMPSLNAAFAV